MSVCAYPPVGAMPLALVMFAPLYAALEGVRPREAFALTYLYSVAFAVFVVRFLVHALAVEYRVPQANAWAVTLLLIAFYAAVPSALMALYAELRPRVGLASAAVLLASLQAISEWLRSVPLACPWVLTPQAVAFSPLWIQTGDIGGIAASAFVVALVSAGVGIALRTRNARALAAALPIVLAALAYGSVRLASDWNTGTPLDVAVVQAAVPQQQRFQPGSVGRNVALHAQLTRALVAEGRPELVFWSETAVDAVLEESAESLAALHAVANETQTPLVTGAQRSYDGGLRNTVVRITPGSDALESYSKQALVPFAESRPSWGLPLYGLLRNVLPESGYWPGESASVFPGKVPFATPICFEITYPHMLREFRGAGAELIVNLSNDAWFGRTGYAPLHLSHAVLRAVELRSWVVRGANTGISALIDPAGRVQHQLGLFENGSLRGRVHATRGKTLYARFGDAPILALLCAFVVAAALRDQGASSATSTGGAAARPGA